MKFIKAGIKPLSSKNIDFCYFDWSIDLFIAKGFSHFTVRNSYVNGGDISFLKDLYAVIYATVETFVVCNM